MLRVSVCLVAKGKVPGNREGIVTGHLHGNRSGRKSVKHLAMFSVMLCHQVLLTSFKLWPWGEKNLKLFCLDNYQQKCHYCVIILVEMNNHNAADIIRCARRCDEEYLWAGSSVWDPKITAVYCTLLSELILHLPQAFSCVELSFKRKGVDKPSRLK